MLVILEAGRGVSSRRPSLSGKDGRVDGARGRRGEEAHSDLGTVEDCGAWAGRLPDAEVSADWHQVAAVGSYCPSKHARPRRVSLTTASRGAAH